MLWDIFCKVIDNYGDIGVCWRLAADLAARGEQVRLWADDTSALAWMAPQGCPGVQVMPWAPGTSAVTPGDAVIETFGCELAPEFIAGIARKTQATDQKIPWVNLEYLSAEAFAERAHGLPSPVLGGPGAGLTKHFFYPGFTPRTGGLLRERDLEARQRAFGARQRAEWLARHGIPEAGERLISLFCYEPAELRSLLAQLANGPAPVRLLVTAGRAEAAMRAAMGQETTLQAMPGGRSMLSVDYLPMLTQWDYDHLLWVSDLNFVRGEDSLVRALWAGKPFVWHIYPQHDDAHHAKLEAFLDAVAAPASLRSFHRAWNSWGNAPLPALDLPAWAQAAQSARAGLTAQPDLAQQLLRFVAEKR
ncbi:MAG TPA: elongation factor P maturation arginine rhamnosyltransferase EarP [Burkholderiaceae bacterium]|nr:elongation factor P maturation arginine rhamnosyltransferase EarP [Burkholderiaceae bacterium]